MRERALRRHPRDRFTDRTIASLNAPGRYADGKGLYLLVGPTGAKSWVLRVKVRGGRREDMGLGSVRTSQLTNEQKAELESIPVHMRRTLTLSEARKSAETWRDKAKTGQSPAQVRRAVIASSTIEKAIPTFEKAAREYDAVHAPTFRNEKHREQWLWSLELVFAAFGTKRIDEVRSGALSEAQESR